MVPGEPPDYDHSDSINSVQIVKYSRHVVLSVVMWDFTYSTWLLWHSSHNTTTHLQQSASTDTHIDRSGHLNNTPRRSKCHYIKISAQEESKIA